MADTRPNIIVPANTVVDIYDATTAHAQGGILPGVKIRVRMVGDGMARLYAGATLTERPDDVTGYTPLYPREQAVNEVGDAGAFIWSDHGCTINVREG